MMKNVYHSDIMQILMLKGKDGMHVAQLTRMVYNLHTNLFDRHLDYMQLHNTIRWYLWRQSKLRRSPFKRISYGCYALKSDMAIQLDFCFDTPLEPREKELNINDESADKVIQLTLDL